MVAVGRFWAGILLVGCGTSPTPSEVDEGSAGKSTGGGGSPPLTLGGSGGHAGGSNTAGTTTLGGSLGVVWPDDFGPVPPGTACEPDFSILEGTVEGQKVSNAYRNSWPILSTFSSWWYSWLAPHGRTQLFTKSPESIGFADPRRDLVPAQVYPVGGWLALDSEGPNPNALYCLNEGSTFIPGEKKAGGQQPIELALSLSKLGTCPGTPVSGNLTFCYGPNQDATCPKMVTGELAGEPIATTMLGIEGMGSGSPFVDVSTFLFGERWLRVRFPETGGALESGLLLDATTTFELTDAYCLDAGTVTSFGGGHSYKVEITSISKLGACSASAPAAGTARVCTETFR